MADGGTPHDSSIIALVVAGIFAVLSNLAGPIFTWAANRSRKKHERRHDHPSPPKRKGTRTLD